MCALKVPKNLWPPFRLPKLVSTEEFNESQNEMMDEEEEESNENGFLNYTNKERLNQMRVDYELRSKSRILNSKSLHAILITILYEHYYTSPVAEKILYFTVYILELALHFSSYNISSTTSTTSTTQSEESTSKFDELNHETWFKSNEIKRNLCTFVPFVSSKYVTVEQEIASVSLTYFIYLKISKSIV